jgi:hydrogenase maturation protease
MRRDDQAGLIAAETLARTGVEGADIVTSETPAIDILTHLDGISLLILIDAAKATDDHPPGAWKRVEYHHSFFVGRPGLSLDSHALGVDAALAIAQAIGNLPEDVWIYAIAARDIGYGPGLTRKVKLAVNRLTRSIPADIRTWRHSRELIHA